jgi:uncharacterized protein (PEP-CTERM system associated)
LAQKIHEKLAKRQNGRHVLRYGAASAALAASLLAAPPAMAQEYSPGPSAGVPGTPAATPAPRASRGPVTPPAEQIGGSSFTGSLIPGFQLSVALDLSETYTTNSYGSSTTPGDDWLTFAGLNVGLNEHSARVSLDATYSGHVGYYAKGSQSTQFYNDLQAVGNVIAIPDYLNIIGRAFAQPVVISNIGPATASGASANGFRNSYGYSIGPDVTFHLGNFANSDTNATYGAAYFTDLAGASAFPAIPGVPGPQNVTMRNVSETLTSGTDFTRLNWSLMGTLSETDRPQGLFAERTGIGTLRYAISPEIALLGTGGYDAISNRIPLTRDISGPVGMGGFELTFGEDFALQVQAGEKYNDFSFEGSLRWNLTSSASLTGSATDTVTTPEGNTLNNLSNLTASANGRLTSSANLYSSGLSSSLGSFSAQPLGSLSYNQQISRVQQVGFTLADDFGRDHLSLTAFGARLTQLSAPFFGPPVTHNVGVQGYLSHDLTRQLSASIGGGYNNYEELGGNAGTYNVNGEISYSASPDTRFYFRADYLNRESSASLQALSPLTQSFSDVRISIGLTHTLL